MTITTIDDELKHLDVRIQTIQADVPGMSAQLGVDASKLLATLKYERQQIIAGGLLHD